MPWTTTAQVQSWLSLGDRDDLDLIGRAVAAAGVVVTRYLGEPPEDPAQDDGAGPLAATMLAARLYRRRNSADGVQAFTPEGALFVARTDPDVARLLRIDQHLTPQVG